MAATSVVKLLESARNSYSLTRTLPELELYYKDDGSLLYHVGNRVVVLKIWYKERWCAMRCYTHRSPRLSEIYGERYLPKELFVYTGVQSGDWIDVVVDDWVEGATLSESIETAIVEGDRGAIKSLADSFDKLATELINSDWAHGDITAENIIVTRSGQLQLIDFDCKFMPQFKGCTSPELGTAAYQPLSRSVDDFDKDIDDYSVALISTSLRAISLDETLYHRSGFCDGLVLNPEHIDNGELQILSECCRLFVEYDMPEAYCVAKELEAGELRIPLLSEVFRPAKGESSSSVLSVKGGKFGYVNQSGDVVIPHINDSGVEFSEGIAIVSIGKWWMAIDYSGDVVMSFDGYDIVEPLKGSVVRACRNGVWEEILI